MTSTAPQRRLKYFFWTVLAFNLLQYLSVAFVLFDLWGHGKLSGIVPYYLVFSGVVLPGLLMYDYHLMVSEYLPTSRIHPWFRIGAISICILQVLVSIQFIFSYLYTLAELNTMPKEIRLGVRLMSLSFVTAALLNLVAAVVLLRTIRKIRKNYRDGQWESFESV